MTSERLAAADKNCAAQRGGAGDSRAMHYVSPRRLRTTNGDILYLCKIFNRLFTEQPNRCTDVMIKKK